MSRIIGNVRIETWTEFKKFLDTESPRIFWCQMGDSLEVRADKDGTMVQFYSTDTAERTAFEPYKAGGFDIG